MPVFRSESRSSAGSRTVLARRKLARTAPDLFPVAAEYYLAQVAVAVVHAEQPARTRRRVADIGSRHSKD